MEGDTLQRVKASELSESNIGDWINLGDGPRGGRGPIMEVGQVPNVLATAEMPEGRSGVFIAILGGGEGGPRLESILDMNEEVELLDSPQDGRSMSWSNSTN